MGESQPKEENHAKEEDDHGRPSLDKSCALKDDVSALPGPKGLRVEKLEKLRLELE